MREVCRALFHRFDWPKWTTGAPQELLALLPPARSTFWPKRTAQQRCVDAVREFSHAFALAVPHEEALAIRDDLGSFRQCRRSS